jgi:hypothetical protein
MTADYENGVLRVTNHSNQPLLVQTLRTQEDEELLNVVVDGGETIDLHPEGELDRAELSVQVVRELDIIAPRTRCVVRHRAEHYIPDVLPEVIFDLGVRLRGGSREEMQEKRLRQKLMENPGSALIASNLGAVLLRKQEYEEALRLLERAYKARLSLPDNGKRTLMLLHELRRKQITDPHRAGKVAVTQDGAGSASRQATTTHEPPTPIAQASQQTVIEGAERMN